MRVGEGLYNAQVNPCGFIWDCVQANLCILDGIFSLNTYNVNEVNN